MENRKVRGAAALAETFSGPSVVVVMICQMLLGLGLGLALILKIYMALFTDYVCVSDSITLGNSIRCTSAPTLVAHGLILVAGFRFAGQFFSEKLNRLQDALLVALVGIFLLFLSDLNMDRVTWVVPFVILSLLASIASVFVAQRVFDRKKDPK
jgi:hypothetical protein